MFAHANLEQKQNKKKAAKSPVQRKKPANRISAPNQTGIPDYMKAQFEHLSGFLFDDVRVYYNSDKPAQLQALAYTQGNQVYVGPGQEKHLVHELGHVVQQKAGRVRPTTNINNVLVNDDPILELEAESKTIKQYKKIDTMVSSNNGDIAQLVRTLADEAAIEGRVEFSEMFLTNHILSGEHYAQERAQITGSTNTLILDGSFLETCKNALLKLAISAGLQDYGGMFTVRAIAKNFFRGIPPTDDGIKTIEMNYRFDYREKYIVVTHIRSCF